MLQLVIHYFFPFFSVIVLAVVKQFQSYMDPEEKVDPVVASIDEDNVALPLGETTLTCNLGVPIIVVCAKVSWSQSLSAGCNALS